jgi:hypothetical protein
LILKPTAEDFEKGDVTAPPNDVVAIPGIDRPDAEAKDTEEA